MTIGPIGPIAKDRTASGAGPTSGVGGELGAERSGGQRLIAQHVEDCSTMGRGEGAEHAVLLLADVWKRI